MLVIIFILIFILIFYNRNYFNESFSNKIESTLTIKESLDLINKNLLNKTINMQYKNIYRPGIITSKLKEKIGCVIKPIIDDINRLTNMNNIIIDYDIIIKEWNKNGDIKYIIDFFMYDIKRIQSNRLITEIIFINNNMNINYVNLSNSIHLKEPNILSGNNIHNIGSNIIIKDENKDNNNLENTIGLENTELEYKGISSKNETNNGKQNISIIRNKWYNPIKNKQNINTFPCRKIYHKWNRQGIMDIQNKNVNCVGIDSSTKCKRTPVGSFNPTLHTLPRDNLGLLGILPFNLAKEVIGMPYGSL